MTQTVWQVVPQARRRHTKAPAQVRFSGSLLECLDCQIAFHGYRGGTVVFVASSGESKLADGVSSICIRSVGGTDLELRRRCLQVDLSE